uniref:Retrovirus-related Pol polyprotein from transposon TNT 1-94 n=1 Tax=Cajanus cajan TaxID=3821 RepID=A0A151TFV4_CAJCA|nr:hypothetical protein KK1_012151 [Cajanus cajan]
MNDLVNIIANVDSIPILNDSNFKSTKDNVLIVLGVIDFGLALRINSHPHLTGVFLNLVGFEVNLTFVPGYTWWIYFGATTHINVFMQGCLSCQKSNDGERYIYIDDDKTIQVETNEKFRLLLKNNRILKDIRRSMINHYTLPKSLCNYILNRISTKETKKTLYEFWIAKKPRLKHLHIWGCRVEARPYRPNEMKLDSRTISCYFVGYSVHDPLHDFVQDIINQDNVMLLRKSTREKRVAIPNDYVVFLQENEVGIGLMEDDSINFLQVIENYNSQKWIDVMNKEIKSMRCSIARRCETHWLQMDI